jgi:hypothetical protein
LIATAIPSRASRRTVAAPMPRDAPVTNATRSGMSSSPALDEPLTGPKDSTKVPYKYQALFFY